MDRMQKDPVKASLDEFKNDMKVMNEKYLDDFKRLVKPDETGIYASSVGVQNEVRSITLTLNTAVLSTAPFAIGFPFRSLYVVGATDSNVLVNLKLATQDSFQDSIPLQLNTSYVLPFSTNKAFLHWTAQTSKTITILFFVHGEFSTNSVQVVQSGGVRITDGSAVAEQAVATVTTTAAQLFASDTTRIKMMISNFGGTSIFIGGTSSVTDDAGGFPGIEIAPGGSYAWENTAACYAISKGGSNTAIGTVKFT